MRVLSLEIRRNACGYTLSMLGQEVPNQGVVGQVRVANAQGAELTLPLSQAQIARALDAIAADAAADANALVSALTPPAFGFAPALEHAGPVQVVGAPAPVVLHAPPGGWDSVDTSTGDDARHAAENPPTLALEVGKQYRTRAGEIATIESIEDPGLDLAYPVLGTIGGAGPTERWTIDGAWIKDSPHVNDRDLVAGIPADAVA